MKYPNDFIDQKDFKRLRKKIRNLLYGKVFCNWEKRYDEEYMKSRFVISISENDNDYYITVWDMWLKIPKVPCKILSFKNNISKERINNKINEYINTIKIIPNKS